MLKENKIFVLIFFFLCLGIAKAKIYYAEVFADIYPDGSVLTNYSFITSNVTSVKIYIENPGKLILPDNCKKIGSDTVMCKFLKNGRARFSEISKVKKKNEKFEYEKSIIISDFLRRSVFMVKLPEGALLPKNGTKFLPLYGSIGTDGRRIFVIWERKDVRKGEIQSVKIFYEFPHSERGAGNFVFVLILLVIIFAFLGMALFYRRKKMLKDLVLPVLKSDEKRVMEIVLKYPKGVNQKVIVNESNYSKGKVSKVLKSLAERGLVRLERRGRTNMVYPVLEFEKK